jgi:hypothetical protein
MIGAMSIFIITLLFIKDDHTQKLELFIKDKNINHHLWDSIIKLIKSYQRTFSHGRIFIQRCEKFPLIPLSIAFWE